MKEITVSLIRDCHTTKSVEDLEKLRCINLNDKQIDKIDNLEVFFDIEELHLSSNRISKIENLDFLNSLQFLDVSYNYINSESLIASIEEESIPKSLKEINISGNPCANDESVLMILQDYIPELLIIVGIEEEDVHNNNNLNHDNNNQVETTLDSGDDESDSDVDEIDIGASNVIYDSTLGKFEEFVISGDTTLNPDELLKRIVDRKCRLQNIEIYNVESDIKSLNYECEDAVKRVSKPDLTTNLKSVEEKIFKNKIDFSTASEKLSKILERTKTERKELSVFMEHLKVKSMKNRNLKFEEIKNCNGKNSK